MYAIEINEETFLLLEAYFGLKKTDQEWYTYGEEKIVDNDEFYRLCKAFQWLKVQQIRDEEEKEEIGAVTATFVVKHPVHTKHMKICLGDALLIDFEEKEIFKLTKTNFKKNFKRIKEKKRKKNETTSFSSSLMGACTRNP